MTIPRNSLRSAVDAKCKGCIYDQLAPGTWREQVAACSTSNCELFDVRPVPRQCRNGDGGFCLSAIADICLKLDVATNARGRRLGRLSG
jgi:hypothetical protein